MHELTGSDQARLNALDLMDYVEKHRELYLYIARRLQVAFPEMTSTEDRIEGIATYIQRLDKDIYGVVRGDLEMRDFCKILAKTVVGHEGDP